MSFREFKVKRDSPKYWRVATKEEMKYITEEFLSKLKKADLYIDKNTFEPFVVVDGIRYSIELIVDRTIS